ncbi:hypothetical protein [Paeniglutamicibacter sp. NPDC091659]|uniref:hypothetical protein n=1 Tax=Paeniglutamicibacter sp. NPDC091659 TaxID=3364389 RepID=UPI00382ADAFC
MRATRAGLWTGTSFCEHIDDRYLGGEQPTDWAMPTMLQIHLPGHPTRTLEVDRYVNAVREEDQELVLFVTPSPPVAHHASEMISYEYRCTALELGPVDQLPEHVKFRDFVPRGWGTPVAPERLGLDNDPFGPTHDSTRIDLSAVVGSRWRHMALTDVQKAQAVKALTDQLGTPIPIGGRQVERPVPSRTVSAKPTSTPSGNDPKLQSI